MKAAAVANEKSGAHSGGKVTCMYSLIRGFSNFTLNVFFGEIDVVGIENMPSEGPVIVVGNHKNQFVDAMMVINTLKRPVSLLVAEKSMHRRVIGDVARMLNAIPVIRPEDRAKKGSGTIVEFDPSKNILKGSSECRFTDEVQVKQLILISGLRSVAAMAVQEIVDDQTMIVRQPLKPDDEADGTGGQPAIVTIAEEGHNFKIIPKIPQTEVFDSVSTALCNGSCIGIFPEGGSSDRTDLLPLKAGVSVMALEANARGANVSIVPFGINYSNGSRWRSKVLVDVGKPMKVSEDIWQRYEMGAKREAQSELLKQIEGSLRAVTFNAPDEDTLNLLRLMRRLYTGNIHLEKRQFMALNRRFALAFEKFREDERFLDLVSRVYDYKSELKKLNVSDQQIAKLPKLGTCSVFMIGFVQMIMLCVLVLFTVITVIPGMILWVWVLLRVRYVVKQEVAKALAGSRVKVKGTDVAASQKIISSSIWAPVILLLWVALATGLTVGLWPVANNPYPPESALSWFFDNAVWLIPLAVLILAPLLAIWNIFLIQHTYFQLRNFPVYTLMMKSLCNRNSIGERLRQRRRELTFRVQEFYDRIISPKFPEWAEDPILLREDYLKDRRKSDYIRANDIEEQVAALANEDPSSPVSDKTRKTIADLKPSFAKITVKDQ